jgi:hypothetical protein
LEIDAEVKRIIKRLQARGFKSPYLRAYVVAHAHAGRRAEVRSRLRAPGRSRHGRGARG